MDETLRQLLMIGVGMITTLTPMLVLAIIGAGKLRAQVDHLIASIGRLANALEKIDARVDDTTQRLARVEGRLARISEMPREKRT